jgi:hypothetical protein
VNGEVTAGFCYHLDDETIRRYQEKSLEQRLCWLYMGNLLRRAYPRSIVEIQDGFRRPAEVLPTEKDAT